MRFAFILAAAVIVFGQSLADIRLVPESDEVTRRFPTWDSSRVL
jgi:hypothetical protein